MTLFRRLGLLAPLAAFALAGCGLNSVPTAEEQVNAEFANLEAEYQRRNDLIGNLVETVKGAAGSEEEILTQLTEAPRRSTSPPTSSTTRRRSSATIRRRRACRKRAAFSEQ